MAVKHRKTILLLAAATLAMTSRATIGQTPADTLPRTMPPQLGAATVPDISNPHFAAARAAAAEENTWRHPGLATCYPGADDGAINSSERTPPPTKIFDNMYFVGENLLSVYALDTSDGIILFDAMDNQQEVDDSIITGLRKLGVDPARIKVVIVSHEHGDHFGGARYLQDKYGVKVYASTVAWDAMDKQSTRVSQRPGPAPLPIKHGIAVNDGDTITLGDETIKVFVTPGHTAGTISMLVPVKYHGQQHLIAYFGGSYSGQTPELRTAFDNSWGRLGQIVADSKAEGFISNHTRYDDSIYKLELLRARPNNPNPFLPGTADTVRFTKEIKECALYYNSLAAAARSGGR
jgi:metallo-beta-lactamase class B